jgi:hypothetical protein
MPRPAAWASAVALYVFAWLVVVAFGLALPLVLALMRVSPRLGCLVMLVFWMSPVPMAAVIHDFVSRLVGARPSAPRAASLASATSWWAGFVAWATIIVVSFTMIFVNLVIDPPPPLEPDAIWNLVTQVIAVSRPVRSAIWIVLAAIVYELELRARATEP